MSSVPIDIEQLSHISGDDSEFESEILLEFCELTADLIGDLQRAASEGDIQTTYSLAHTIKGSARTIGAIHVADVAEVIEAGARSGEASQFQQGLAQLIAAFRDVEAFVHERCTSDAA